MEWQQQPSSLTATAQRRFSALSTPTRAGKALACLAYLRGAGVLGTGVVPLDLLPSRTAVF